MVGSFAMWILLARPRHARLSAAVDIAAVIAPLIFLALVSTTKPAAALDVTCIESSRYMYLYKLFGDDKQRFGAYFNVDPAYLPPPWTCRAALVSGHVEPKDADAVKLLQMIAQNGGWLDTLYLDSGGGDVFGGVRMALVTRDFWLKTRVAPPGAAFTFDPDFGPPATASPPDPGRLAFDRAAAAVASPTNHKKGNPFCASACTYTLAAGIDRHGTALVHRPRNGLQSLGAFDVRAQNAEAMMMSIYKKMDVGDAFMALTRATAAATTSRFVVSRHPRFLEDTLLTRCKSDGAQLDDLAALLRLSGSGHSTVGLAQIHKDPLKAALAKLEARRQTVAQCVTALNEKERFEAFGRLCPSGCNVASLRAKVREEFESLKK